MRAGRRWLSITVTVVWIVLATTGVGPGAAPSNGETEADSGSGLAAESIHTLLEAADLARGHPEGVRWHLTVRSWDGEEETGDASYEVAARGYDVLAIGTAPRKNRDHRILLVEGSMWYHKPGLSKPVAISRRQRLLGQASYGDIASTHYADDYQARWLRTDSLDGESCHVLALSATSKETTYDRIEYWVSVARSVGLQAFYYTVSGRLMKTSRMTYDNRREDDQGQDGAPFISSLSIRDAVEPAKRTELSFESPRFVPIDDASFQISLFGR